MNGAARVALFADSFHEVNGVGLTCRQFEAFAQRRGLPMFSCHAGPRTRSWSEGSIMRFEFSRSSFGFPIESDLRFDLLFTRHLGALKNALLEFQPDIVHITGPSDCGFLGALAAYQLGLPVAASWHTNVHEYGARRFRGVASRLPARFREFLVRRIEHISLDLTLLFYSLSRVCYAPNPELAAMLAGRLGKPVHLMLRGIDTGMFAPRAGRRPCGPFRIGYVGRLSREKGVDALVEVEEALLGAGLRDFEFVITGAGGQRSWLERNLRHARFTGVLKGEQLAAEYASLDVFLFPSRTDTFGNVVLEAIASGVPAIVTDSGGPRYLVHHARTGFIVSSPREAAKRIFELARRPGLLASMSVRARNHALRAHSWDSVFEGVYAGYSTVLRLEPQSKPALCSAIQA
jgi:glycosyltransferase involved in cell wall biosynthesis